MIGILLLENDRNSFDDSDILLMIEKTKVFYKNSKNLTLSDDIILVQWMFPERNLNIDTNIENDPFIRMWNKDNILNADKVKEIELKQIDGIYKLNLSTRDEVLLRALYCDVNGYSELDYYMLQLMQDSIGGYGDTHFLLGLLLLESQGCGNSLIISKDLSQVVSSILEAQRDDTIFNDLYAERIVFLTWSGNIEFIEHE